MEKELGKYSFGMGDRFGKEGEAQLQAVIKMHELGVQVRPVWNKSYREHTTVGSKPESVKAEADAAVENLSFQYDYHVDADHITLKTVDPFIPVSDFFTIDVAEYIGNKIDKNGEQEFLEFFENYSTGFTVKGIEEKFQISGSQLEEMSASFLLAMQEAGKVYSYISERKQGKYFIEVSVDEVAEPQSPVELFFILAALAFYKVPVNTIAPKFTGRFSKGVDYEGDIKQFTKEFEEDILVIKYAIKEFGLPRDLKLSVHSGSDKFSIYPVINKLINKHDTGLHLKTAGTTWLEELIGLAESEGEAFNFSRELYREALERYDELTEDYESVLAIDKDQLPNPDHFKSGKNFANALRHDQSSEAYNPHFRQLLHCAYKIAGEKEEMFLPLLEKHRKTIETNVTENLLEKHLKLLFL